MATKLTLRQTKGSPLTFQEGDDNFKYLDEKSDAAMAIGKVYDTKEAGLAAVRDTDTFWVKGTGDIGAILYRRVSASEAVEEKKLLSEQFKADLADPAKGAALIGFKHSGAASVGGNVQAALDMVAYPSQFGALGGENDDTNAIQAALNSGAKFVYAMDKVYTCDEITVPSGVSFFFKLKKKTPMGSVIKTHSETRLIGSIVGSGIGSYGNDDNVEIGIQEAAPGVNNVYLDVSVEALIYGVYANEQNDTINMPDNWHGHITANNLSGDGSRRGYGLLCAPAKNFNLTVVGENIPRHALYLTNGSYGNKIDVHVDGIKHGAVQLAAYENQNAVHSNEIRIFARRIEEGPNAGNSFAANLVGKVEYNSISIEMSDSPNATGVALLRSLSNNAVCRGNTVTAKIRGAVKGQSILRSDAGVENSVAIAGYGGSTYSAGASALIGVFNYGDAPLPSGDYQNAVKVVSVDYDAAGTNMRGVSAAANYALTDIGQESVNFYNSLAPTVVDNTSGNGGIVGYIFSERVKLTASAVAAGGQTSISHSWKKKFTSAPTVSMAVVQPGATGTNAPSVVIPSLSATAITASIKNNLGSASNIIVHVEATGN